MHSDCVREGQVRGQAAITVHLTFHSGRHRTSHEHRLAYQTVFDPPLAELHVSHPPHRGIVQCARRLSSEELQRIENWLETELDLRIKDIGDKCQELLPMSVVYL